MTERLKLRVIPSQKRLRAIALLDYLQRSPYEHMERCEVARAANNNVRRLRRHG